MESILIAVETTILTKMGMVLHQTNLVEPIVMMRMHLLIRMQVMRISMDSIMTVMEALMKMRLLVTKTMMDSMSVMEIVMMQTQPFIRVLWILGMMASTLTVMA